MLTGWVTPKGTKGSDNGSVVRDTSKMESALTPTASETAKLTKSSREQVLINE